MPPTKATSQADLNAWAAALRVSHPEMFDGAAQGSTVKRTARHRWHPLFLRVYGIRPWEMGSYNLREFGQLVQDLEQNGLGGGLG